MGRIRELNRYQKAILLILVAMAVFFAVVYTLVISRVGFSFKDEILIPGTQNGNTVYSGTVAGGDCVFTVTPDKTVTFRCGNKSYGPYTALEDPTAIPAEYAATSNCVGVELREGARILFRGAVLTRQQTGFNLIDENGDLHGFGVVVTMSDGTRIDENGNVVDPWEPSVYTILELMGQPELTHKGTWSIYLLGLCLSAVIAVSILFADELFRLSLSFRVYDPYRVEPSDWEITGRYISWTIMPIMTLILYITGLE